MTAFDDLVLLRAFVSIVECGSISAGARRLGISQPTLSRYLRALEERSGSALLDRDTHHLNLTEPGQRLLTDARAMLTHAEQATQRLREDQTTLAGHLRIFATIDCGQSVVTRMLSEFLQLHPEVTASLSLANRPLHMIQEGCDVGILPGKIADESVIARPAGAISLHLAAAPALINCKPAAKKPADLKSWPWVTLAGPQFWNSHEVRLFGPKGAEHTLAISPVLVSEGVTSVREAVRSGLGVATLPDWLLRKDLESGRLVRLLPRWRTRDLPIHVVYASHRLLPTRARAFAEYAITYMKAELERENDR